jgi:hypothetical protein
MDARFRSAAMSDHRPTPSNAAMSWSNAVTADMMPHLAGGLTGLRYEAVGRTIDGHN